ncbi:MAG: tRNA (adenosine(37)-N6)-threonylcarbamoyltransferase complex ATPase subunit type 1 TsaE [Candidatus Delongbacteria bacterium]|nr:tRNA (adenosine(37)-N6)-threonylcarbamoyltransferase complex ATPase subunit type 1 TsaE [Candidatus Delongbacteria bacterium]
MKYQAKHLCHSLDQTRQLAVRVASHLIPGVHFTLDGPLGSGKTTFIRFLAAALGVDSNRVDSPTFTLIHQYPTPQRTLFHLDLYRLKSSLELDELGLSDQLDDPANLFLVEWAYKVRDYDLFYPLIGIFIKPLGPHSRQFYFFSDCDETEDFFANITDSPRHESEF